MPNDLEGEAVDIIDKLLQLDPRNRLGIGKEGTELSFSKLKEHPFFNGINFETLDQTSPPIPADRYLKFFSDLKANANRISQDSLFFNQGFAGSEVAHLA